jgi:tetratricopeptide (TPR) repeat protein
MRIALTVVVSLLGAAGPGYAQTIVAGTGYAADCSQRVVKGKSDTTTLDLCTRSIQHDTLKRTDAAKTHVNRGVVYLRRGALEPAAKDFARAEALMPELAETFVNRGAVLMQQRRWADAIAQIDRGISLKPAELEKAYFNRGLAREQVDDLRGAYADFKMAAKLKPDWEAPRAELQRYTVTRR